MNNSTSVKTHININDGIGVKQLIFIKEMAAGKCPFRAPTKNKRDDAKIAPFKEPKVEHATNNGIINANDPNILFANVTYKWKNKNYGRYLAKKKKKKTYSYSI